MKEIKEAIRVIQELNQELYEKHSELNFSFLFKTDGYIHEISFGEIALWHSEEDDRVFNEDVQLYEPLLEYVVKEFNEMADTLSAVKLSLWK